MGRAKLVEAVDDHEEEAAGDEPAAGLDKLPNLGKDFFQLWLRADAVRSAVVARPVLREGRSAASIP